MPWQTAPVMMIMIGAFTATGLIMPAFQRFINDGKNKRIKIDEWTYQLDRRDVLIQNARADKIARQILEAENPPSLEEEPIAAH